MSVPHGRFGFRWLAVFVLSLCATFAVGCTDAAPDTASGAPASVAPTTGGGSSPQNSGAVSTLLHADATTAELDVNGALTELAVAAGAPGAGFVRAAFSAGAPPALTESPAHVVAVSGAASGHLTVALDPAVTWIIHVNGAVPTATLQLTALHVAAVVVSGAGSSVALSLPAPGDSDPIDVAAPFATVVIHLAHDVRAVLSVSGGADTVTVDGSVTTAVTSTQIFPVSGGSSNAYSMTVRGRAGSITVDHLG